MLFLEVTDIFTRNSKRINLEKPKSSNLSDFKANIKSKDSFDIISKSFSKDQKTSTSYIISYNIEGNKLNETAFSIDLKDYYFLHSFNGGGLGVKMINDGNLKVYEQELSDIYYKHFTNYEIPMI